MTQGYESLQAQVTAITACETGAQVFDMFWSTIRHFSFSSALIARANSMAISLADDGNYFAFNNLPKWWDERYLAKSYGYIDPCAHMVMRRTGPFRWSECYHNLTPAQEAMIADARSHGLNYGINFPMHGSDGGIGLVLLGSGDDFSLSQDDVIYLEILARYSYNRIKSLFGPFSVSQDIVLSDRERDILTLVAQGKTNWEIGAILEISEYSVRDYLKVLSRRMQTSNRTHTVTRALQMGLIIP